MDLKTRFEDAASRSRSLGTQPNDVLLRLYALYKQATVGDVTGPRPGGFDFVARAKYDAWSGLAGTTAEQAMENYIALVDERAHD